MALGFPRPAHESLQKRYDIGVNTASLLWGLLFGSIGVGFFIYGKRQQMIVPLVCGLALMVYPYFVAGTLLILLIGVALMAAPYFLRF
jgi:hypothetical protein